MTHKASAINMVWKGGKGETQALRRVVLAVMGLAVVGLAVASVYVLVAGLEPETTSGVMAGLEASSARWAAVGGRSIRGIVRARRPRLSQPGGARWVRRT